MPNSGGSPSPSPGVAVIVTTAFAALLAASPLYAPGGPMEVAFEQAAKTAVPRPPHPAYPAITLAAQTAFTDMFDGADPQTELTKAAEEIDADIEDNDGYPPFGGN